MLEQSGWRFGECKADNDHRRLVDSVDYIDNTGFWAWFSIVFYPSKASAYTLHVVEGQDLWVFLIDS